MKANLCQSALVLALAVLPAIASADAVSCGDATLGVRLTEVEPGKVGGLCYAQNGNLDTAFVKIGDVTTFVVPDNASPNTSPFPAIVLTLLEKSSDFAKDTFLGDWSVDMTDWLSWTRLYLGFHFGHGGDVIETNPDSFIVELNPVDLTGSWELTGPGGVLYLDNKGKDVTLKLNGLSNFYVFGSGTTIPCERTNSCGGGTPGGGNGNGGGTPANGNGSGQGVPEPGSLALVGLALLGLGAARRRRA